MNIDSYILNMIQIFKCGEIFKYIVLQNQIMMFGTLSL